MISKIACRKREMLAEKVRTQHKAARGGAVWYYTTPILICKAKFQFASLHICPSMKEKTCYNRQWISVLVYIT